MSDYKIGAFDALEWVWHTLRRYKDQPKGFDEAKRVILATMSNMGMGDKLNFSEKISEVEYAN